ncbi:hypothetical protein NLI96_g129 [Meripilus lineatus]|uniref:Uncharacterized protein n=1 Tax=Meripilus lineatus TaxID=2056292 RepID=A0AAD5YMB7_9APHY|nr:hypothetical protein NLI96_g129 [Physisporinus lineatus]
MPLGRGASSTSQHQKPLSPAPGSKTVIDDDPFATPPPSASDTITGATSQDVYESAGKPGSGMSSQEMHHDGKAHRKRSLQGKDQYGTANEIFG